MRIAEKEQMKINADRIYRDPAEWNTYAITCPSRRLEIASRFFRIMELCGLKNSNLLILDIGCGNGFFSPVFAIAGKVYAFDHSSEGVRTAKEMFSTYGNIVFFEGDGEHPKGIKELSGKKFDLMIMREFHPLSRDYEGRRDACEIVSDYYDMLSDQGIMIIEHAVKSRKVKKEISLITRKFNALVSETYSLNFVLPVFSIKEFSRTGIRSVFKMSRLLSPLVRVICFLKKSYPTKTIVIRK